MPQHEDLIDRLDALLVQWQETNRLLRLIAEYPRPGGSAGGPGVWSGGSTGHPGGSHHALGGNVGGNSE